MANTLGTVDLGEIVEYNYEDGLVSVSGKVSSKSALDDIQALFRKAKGNTRVEKILGGIYKGIDLTTSYINWKEAAFDADQPYDGWHLLLGFKYQPQNIKNYYPYLIEMQYFESTDVSAESVGTGDGTETVFNLDNYPVVSTSETIKLDGTATSAYSIVYDEGEITFDSAPGGGVAVTADYAYFNT